MVLPNFNKTVKGLTKQKGFVLCGVSEAKEVSESASVLLQSWIERGCNGSMEWFNKNCDIRNNPSLLFDGAKCVVSVAYQYPLVESSKIASYAHQTDYHYTLKSKLQEVIEELQKIYNTPITARAFVDSAPIMERYWAVRSGLGWIGRSGMLINREYGGNLLLAEIVLDAESDIYDSEDSFNGCDGCHACVDSCPNMAIDGKRLVDARKCVSYLTIEHRGDFNDEQKGWVKRGDMLFGCDRCIDSCRWNFNHKRVAPLIAIDNTILEMSNSQFKRRYGDTPLSRSGLKGIKRNFIL